MEFFVVDRHFIFSLNFFGEGIGDALNPKKNILTIRH